MSVDHILQDVTQISEVLQEERHMKKGMIVFLVFWMLFAASQEISRALISGSDAKAEEVTGPRRTLRDPFVPPIIENAPIRNVDKKTDTAKKADVQKKPIKPRAVAPPPYSLTGIILGGSGASAIIFNPSTRASGILMTGDTMGGYTVTSITAGKVVLTRQSKVFNLELHRG
jgi:hypothetical protein